jgi:hypothetical protein
MQLQLIQRKIYEIRGHKVMLDFDLAEMYGTETKRLKEAVRRNIQRFPPDFMFELTRTEYTSLRSQIVTSNATSSLRTQFATLEKGRGKYSKFNPFAFTEQGVAMLSSVLNSKQAVQVNIAIIRTFVLMRQYALSHKDLTDKLKKMEHKYKKKFTDIETALTYLIEKDQQETEQKERKRIGYKA